MIFLISYHKSCEVIYNIWTQFSVAGIYVFELGGFHDLTALPITMMVFLIV